MSKAMERVRAAGWNVYMDILSSTDAQIARSERCGPIWVYSLPASDGEAEFYREAMKQWRLVKGAPEEARTPAEKAALSGVTCTAWLGTSPPEEITNPLTKEAQQ